ncbi:MAG: DNA topoisomerase III [Staphylococcus equorum]|nr:DNA topoisomerase III [Staphylococcus equorum]
MKPVIIAEKPSQAKAYAEAFKVKKKDKTYIELVSDDIFPNGAYITWGIGHLVELKLPQDTTSEVNTWNLSNLPYLPKQYEYKVSDGKSAQFNSIKRLCKDAEYIINGCDVDREGSNIFYLILDHAGIKNKTIKRLWINSLEADEVRKGFKNLQSNEKDILMYEEARARMVSDYLIGMNLSPLYTIKMRNLGLDNMVFGIGRVQTPTLYMIYQRQQEIDTFKSEPYYEVHGKFKKDEESYTGKMKFKETDRNKAEAIVNDMSDATVGIVSGVEKTLKKQQSPKLHSLSTLQTTANKRWKYSPKQTLKIMQSLYEKKLVSYPRTDTQHITDQEFNYLKERLDDYRSIYNLDMEVVYHEPRKRFVDGSRVQEHYAIILTKQSASIKLDQLSEQEKNIFKEIYTTTMAMFLPDYEYETTTLITAVNQYEFFTSGRVDKKLGWKTLFKQENDKEDTEKLPDLTEGEQVQATINLHEGMTQPPKLFTEGQLINLMKTCGKVVEDQEDVEILKTVEGIGTEATRADVIDKLKHHEYIKVVKNIVNITDKGQLLCQAVTGTLLSSPEMTAKWEKTLKNISQQTMTFTGFIEGIHKYITHQVDVVDEELQKNNVSSVLEKTKKENSYGQCPKCQKSEIVKRKAKVGNIYPCSNEDCDFIIFGKMFGRSLPDNTVKELIEKGQTQSKVKGFISKAGKKYDAYLEMNKEYSVRLKFDK